MQPGRIPFGNGSNRGGLQFNQGNKVHIESLKLRTRCAKCGVVGHWARECTSPPDDHAKNRMSAAASTAKSGASSSLSGRSGFVHVSSSCDEPQQSMVTLSEVFQVNSFCGVATHGAYGLVDAAAQSGLIGKEALGRLEKILENFGLKENRSESTSKRGWWRGKGEKGHRDSTRAWRSEWNFGSHSCGRGCPSADSRKTFEGTSCSS